MISQERERVALSLIKILKHPTDLLTSHLSFFGFFCFLLSDCILSLSLSHFQSFLSLSSVSFNSLSTVSFPPPKKMSKGQWGVSRF